MRGPELDFRPLPLCSGPGRKSALECLEPPDQADGWLGQVGEIVAGQARQLEVGNFVHVAAIFRAQRQEFADIEINAAAVNECGLGLVITGVVCQQRTCASIILPNFCSGSAQEQILPRFFALQIHVIRDRAGIADFFRHGFCLGKQQQIIRAAGF